MKSLLGLGAGGAIVNILKATPPWIKVPLIFGAGVLVTTELNMEFNHSWFSPQMYGGEAAKGQAQIDDPAATRRAIQSGQPVTGAAATMAAQVRGLDADAAQKAAYADAANESEAEILAKKSQGIRITSTEELRLRELQLKSIEVENQLNQLAGTTIGVKTLRRIAGQGRRYNTGDHSIADSEYARAMQNIDAGE